MSENMYLWNKLHKPPTTALKSIQAGRLKGKSDINPQWRMQAMTEACGPCGFGWKYTVDRQWLEPGANGEVCAFSNVSLYYKHEGEWSEPIPGHGGSMFVANEKNGPYTSDEAFKMSITDALSVAFKAIGMAAEIYLGNFDGSKYTSQPTQTPSLAAQPQNIDPKDAEYHTRTQTALKAIYGENKTAALDKVEELTTFTPKGKTEPVKGVRNFLTLKGDRAKYLAQNLEKLVPKEPKEEEAKTCSKCDGLLTADGLCPACDEMPFQS